ncbi:MAG: hypothetical protein ACP5TZ_01345 [Nitrososphaeria archaeon]
MENHNEQIIGIIMYSAIQPDYTLKSIVFTDRRVLEVPLSKMSELVSKTSQLPSVLAFLLEAANPFTFTGLGSLVGFKMWKDFKKKTEGKQVVFSTSGLLPQEITEIANRELNYDGIKSLKIKKVPMSTDAYIGISAGFWHSSNIVFDGRAMQEVRDMILKTPLAPKLHD